MNNQRRIFRGRGGPTDGRLPKHNARRRKQHQNGDEEPKPPKYDGPPPSQQQRRQQEENDEEIISADGQNSLDESENMISEETPQPQEEDDAADSEARQACLKEIKHLHRRIRNVQESIQTSTSIVTPSVYQEIVLNAVSNCVNEWRSIARHYAVENDAEEENSSAITPLPPEVRKETGLKVFMLIQLSLQSGPLAGAKPGYFKRCGSDVAKMVGKHLEDVIPQTAALTDCMGFSPKQMDAMNKWKSNAEKAVNSGKGPSKSVLKKQQNAKGKGKK